jgi:hypothetical protein
MSIDTGLSLTYRANYPIPDINQSSQPFRDNFSILKQSIEHLQTMSSTANSIIAVSPILSSADGSFTLELTYPDNALTLPMGLPSGNAEEGMLKYEGGHLSFFDGDEWRDLYSSADRLPGLFAHLEVSDGTGNTAMVADYANGVTINSLVVNTSFIVPVTGSSNTVVLPTANGAMTYSEVDGTWYFGSNGSSDGFKVNMATVGMLSVTEEPSANTDAVTVHYLNTRLNSFSPDLSGFLASPHFTGTPTAPTPVLDNVSNTIATTAFVAGQDYLTNTVASQIYASIESPSFTGSPSVPTPNASDTSNTVATTAFVKSLGFVTKSQATANVALTGTATAPTPATNDNSSAIATTGFVAAQNYIKANTVAATYSTINSPTFTGTPRGPTAATNDVSTRLATTEWVNLQGYVTSAALHGLSGTAVRMAADMNYDVGTVVILGGSAEVTASNQPNDARVMGVVVNSGADLYFNGSLSPTNPNNLLIATSGRAFIKAVGPISPGDLLVTSITPGLAQAFASGSSLPAPGTVIGKAITSIPSGEGVLEIVIMPC